MYENIIDMGVDKSAACAAFVAPIILVGAPIM